MSADRIMALAERLAENRGDYERTAFTEPRGGVCDACSEDSVLVAKWPTYDGAEEPWLCGPCDSLAQDEQAAVNALPKVAALVAAVELHGAAYYTEVGSNIRFCADCHAHEPCPIVLARDALVAALGVDSE